MSLKKQSLSDVSDLKDKRIIVRVDYNVPLDKKDGHITDDTRITATLPTLRFILAQKPKSVVLMSHLGRPDGMVNPRESLNPVAMHLEKLLCQKVVFLNDCVGEEVETCVESASQGEVILLENLRFHAEEEGKGIDKDGKSFKPSKESIAKFRESLSKLGEIFVNDAFGTAHRAHSSMVGVNAKKKVAGLLMEKELTYFSKVLTHPSRPVLAILGGAKIRDKIKLIGNLIKQVDELIIGGGMAYTFLKVTQGMNIGKSLFDEEGAKMVKDFLQQAQDKGVKIHLPVDFVIADKFDKDANTEIATVSTGGIKDGWEGLDCGPETVKLFQSIIEGAKTIVWNGPLGVIEMEKFAGGSRGVLEAVIDVTKRKGVISVIGGGDTAGFVCNEGKEKEVSHVSTGGGASLELLEGTVLPGVQYLDDKME